MPEPVTGPLSTELNTVPSPSKPTLVTPAGAKAAMLPAVILKFTSLLAIGRRSPDCAVDGVNWLILRLGTVIPFYKDLRGEH